MNGIRQNCSRCDTPILFQNINKDSGIYKCNSCDIVSSIYDHADYKVESYNEELPPNTTFEILANEIYYTVEKSTIYGKGSQWVVVPALGMFFGLYLIIFSGLLYFFLLIICIVAIALIMERARKPVVFKLNPNTLTIYRKLDNRQIVLDQFPSYMIDQITIKGRKKNQNDKKGAQPLAGFVSFEIITKDVKFHKVLYGMQANSKEFLFAERMIEDYLGLKDRHITGEFEE